MLIDQGVLERRNGGWVSAAGLADVSIPDSVHGVIAARIDLLEAVAAMRSATARSSGEASGRRPSESTRTSSTRSGAPGSSRTTWIGDGRDARVRVQARLDARRRLLDAAPPRAPGPAPAGGGVDPGHRARPRRRGGSSSPPITTARRSPTARKTALSGGPSKRCSRRARRPSAGADFEAASTDRTRAGARRRRRAARRTARARPAGVHRGRFDDRARELDVVETQLAPDDAELRSDVLAWRSRGCWLTGRWDEAFSPRRPRWRHSTACPSRLSLRAHSLASRRSRC